MALVAVLSPDDAVHFVHADHSPIPTTTQTGSRPLRGCPVDLSAKGLTTGFSHMTGHLRATAMEMVSCFATPVKRCET